MSAYTAKMVTTLTNLAAGSAFLFEGYWVFALMLFLIGLVFVASAIKDAVA